MLEFAERRHRKTRRRIRKTDFDVTDTDWCHLAQVWQRVRLRVTNGTNFRSPVPSRGLGILIPSHLDPVQVLGLDVSLPSLGRSDPGRKVRQVQVQGHELSWDLEGLANNRAN